LNIALALARRKAGDDLEQEHDRISQEADRLNSLVHEMLLLARLESGNEVNKEPLAFDVRAVVEEAHENAMFESGQLRKIVTINSIEGFVVRGYPVLLQRAIDNVLRNALRFAQRHVSIQVSRSRMGAAHVGVIVIRDDGPGIGPGQEEAIFEPFLTLSGSELSGVGGGSGLGLAIARQAVLANGGRISAHGSAEGGLIVEIELPAEP
jgi:two-component system sensor histidine kinase CpxA